MLNNLFFSAECHIYVKGMHPIKNNVRQVIASIDVNILQSVLASFIVRIDECIESGGGRAES